MISNIYLGKVKKIEGAYTYKFRVFKFFKKFVHQMPPPMADRVNEDV